MLHSIAGNRPPSSPISVTNSRHTLKIAIIGAGCSGIAAAAALRRNGYQNVVIYERDHDIGGKVQSIHYAGRSYELGAIIANHDYKAVMDLARAQHQTFTEAETACLVDHLGQKYSYDQFVKSRYGLRLFLQSALRFWRIVRGYPRLKQAGFAGMPSSLQAPMRDFAQAAGIEPIAEVMHSFLTGCGYGYYEHIPAMYYMKLAPWLLKQVLISRSTFGLAQGWSTFDAGWQALLREQAKTFNIRLGTPVTRVNRVRSNGDIRIAVEADGGVDVFDRLILASPLDQALRFLDASAIERALFKRIRNVRYLTTIVEAKRLGTLIFADHVDPATIGRINVIIRMHRESNVVQIYQILDDATSIDQAMALARRDIAAVHGQMLGIIAQKEWSYFPHVASKDLAAGYYETLESLQGVSGTYYVGGLLSFETVEHTMAYAQDLVARFFRPQAQLNELSQR